MCVGRNSLFDSASCGKVSHIIPISILKCLRAFGGLKRLVSVLPFISYSCSMGDKTASNRSLS